MAPAQASRVSLSGGSMDLDISRSQSGRLWSIMRSIMITIMDPIMGHNHHDNRPDSDRKLSDVGL